MRFGDLGITTPETQTHRIPQYQLLRLTVIFGPYLAWPSPCINAARDAVVPVQSHLGFFPPTSAVAISGRACPWRGDSLGRQVFGTKEKGFTPCRPCVAQVVVGFAGLQ